LFSLWCKTTHISEVLRNVFYVSLANSSLSLSLSLTHRFRDLQYRVSELAAGSKIGFSQTVYLSEKDSSHRNSAIANFMKAENGFPEGVNISNAVDFFLQGKNETAIGRLISFGGGGAKGSGGVKQPIDMY